MDQTWTTINRLVTWLDDQNGADGDTARLMRVLKIYEEIGEVAQEVEITIKGNAPWRNAHKEICDVLITGMVALASLTPDAPRILQTWALTDEVEELPDVWDNVTRSAHQPGAASPAGTSVPVQLMRITRTAGLVAEAVHGAMGTNPRKGASHTWADVHQRLAALIVQVMEFLASLTHDAQGVFSRRLSQVAERSGALR